MRYAQLPSRMVALLGVLVLSIGCSHSRDPALQRALDELTKLQSACDAGISFSEFDTRFLTAKGNIDATLARASDSEAKLVIDRAVLEYEFVRRMWNGGYEPDPGNKRLALASEYAEHAKSYVAADRGVRNRLAAEMIEKEKVRAQQLAAMLKAREAETKASREANKSYQRELDAERDRRTKEAVARERAYAAETATERQKKTEVDKQKTEEDRQRSAENAEREHKRRFAPDGVVFNLKPIRVVTGNRSTVIAAETALVLGKKNEDGTLHVKWNKLETDVPADDVTNDRDWLDAYRNLHTGESR